MLLTAEDCKIARAFPKLPDELRGEGRVPKNEALKYLEDVTYYIHSFRCYLSLYKYNSQ